MCLFVVLSLPVNATKDSLFRHSIPKLNNLEYNSAPITYPNCLIAKNTDNNGRKGKKDQKKVIIDSDSDGVPDSIDLCPEMPGSIATKGCPDSDGDGVPDFEDNCPNIAGLAEFKGCPDTDGDGIPDNLDVCPNEKGSASNSGCPINEMAVVATTEINTNLSKIDLTVKDTDKDSVPDVEDLCPTAVGSKKTFGCPDVDEDGIPDFEDDCPFTPGLARYKGCPDTDEDGIPDNFDACPYEAGPTSNSGCPILTIDYDQRPVAEVRTGAIQNSSQPIVFEDRYKNPETDNNKTPHTTETDNDTDDDGIPDSEDKCPNIPGHKSNNGCPLNPSKLVKVTKRDIILFTEERTILENIFTNIAFDKGRMFLTTSSYPYLDKLTELLTKRLNWNITVICFTNEADNSYRNQQLSSNRGKQVQNYLIAKGIPQQRIDVKGNGNLPVADLPPNRIELLIGGN